jgi:tetratricopeptide (TPR) repeat protein
MSSLLFSGCGGGPAIFLGARDAEIKDATQALETARDDAQRAKAYSERGAAYSEKARYSRISKLVPDDEYQRLFDLAIKDHNQAVALNPSNPGVYFNRAQAYYDRGSLDLVFNQQGSKTWFDPAAADFEKAVEKDPKELTFDRLGLTYESNLEWDKAIQAYTHELAFTSFGKQRLADVYCNMGFHQKDFAAAAEAYQKSMEFGTADDHSCPVDPFGAMIAIYTNQTHEYDKAWEMLHQAQKLGRWIAPELIEKLKRESARTN